MSPILVKCSFLAVVSVWLFGCGESAPAPEKEAMGPQVKKQIQDFVEAAKKTPAKAPEQLAAMKESLEAKVAEYGEEFAPVKQAADELQALYERKAPKAEIDAGLQKLSDAANALPQ